MGHRSVNPPRAFPVFPGNNSPVPPVQSYFSDIAPVFLLPLFVLPACSITHNCKPWDRRKCLATLSMSHQMLWFLGRLEERGQCVSPGWLSVSSYFYSKADCSVSGCLYAISIIRGEERPLLHASQRDDTSPPASPRVESFFFHIAGCLCFFSRCLWCRQSQRSVTVCVFLDRCWLADSFTAVQGRNGQAH